MIKRLFPHPNFSLLLAVIWLLLVQSISLGHVLLALLSAWAIPYFSVALWPRHPPLHRPLLIVRYALVLAFDIVSANFVVMSWILGPTKRLKPAFVVYPLTITDRQAISVLASTISLTPGTVSADLSMTRKELLIHTLNVDDQSKMIESIRKRYEQPLKEIFE
jgi:multicomponent K+:H+ antiporter subunit E